MAVPRPTVSPATEPALGPFFDDIRQTLQISWIPRVFVALGQIPGYLPLAWGQLKPSLSTAQFVRLAERIRRDTISAAESMYVPSYGPGDLQHLSVSLDEQAELRTALDALIFGETQTLLATKALRLAIEDCPPGGTHPISWPRSLTTWAMQPIPTVDQSAIGEDVRRVFREAQRRLRMSWPPRSLEVIAPWPGYLREAWNDLSGVFQTPEFPAGQTDLIEQSAAYCQLFPTKVDATPEQLQRNGESTFEIGRARDVLMAHDDVLPADLLLTACLRAPLGGLRVTSQTE